MKKVTAEQQEGFLIAIVLLIGILLMLIAGQFALQMPTTWQISDINMDSKLNPNEVYALYREDYDFRLAPIRTDIPNLLATRATATLNSGSPPLAVEFKAPGQIETTTPFQFSFPAVAATATTSQTASTSVTVQPTSSETPTPTLTPSQTLWPTSTASRTATRAATRTRTQTTTATLTGTATPSTTATSTSTAIQTITITPTSTAVPVNTVTHTSVVLPSATHTPTVPGGTATDTPTPTATDTSTPTAILTTPPLSTCIITGSNNYVIPVGGCTASYDTAAQGAIFSLDMVGSGSLSVSWFGLLENQTDGICAAQSSNLTPGKNLANLAVAKTTTTAFTIDNSTGKTITIQITVSDWLVGGCQ